MKKTPYTKRIKNLTDYISATSPLAMKRISINFEKYPDTFFDQFDTFLRDYDYFLQGNGLTIYDAIDCYLHLCNITLRHQIDFAQTKEYPTSRKSILEVKRAVYDNEPYMKKYMIGLALTQFLWNSHNQLYNFFTSILNKLKSSITSYLEVGPGHGLFSKYVLENKSSSSKKISLVDISESSLKLTKQVLQSFNLESGHLT